MYIILFKSLFIVYLLFYLYASPDFPIFMALTVSSFALWEDFKLSQLSPVEFFGIEWKRENILK